MSSIIYFVELLGHALAADAGMRLPVLEFDAGELHHPGMVDTRTVVHSRPEGPGLLVTTVPAELRAAMSRGVGDPVSVQRRDEEPTRLISVNAIPTDLLAKTLDDAIKAGWVKRAPIWVVYSQAEDPWGKQAVVQRILYHQPVPEVDGTSPHDPVHAIMGLRPTSKLQAYWADHFWGSLPPWMVITLVLSVMLSKRGFDGLWWNLPVSADSAPHGVIFPGRMAQHTWSKR